MSREVLGAIQRALSSRKKALRYHGVFICELNISEGGAWILTELQSHSGIVSRVLISDEMICDVSIWHGGKRRRSTVYSRRGIQLAASCDQVAISTELFLIKSTEGAPKGNITDHDDLLRCFDACRIRALRRDPSPTP